MQQLILVMIGLPTLPAILRKIVSGFILTLLLAPRELSFSLVLSKYLELLVTSSIRTQPYLPLTSSKYLGSSIGRGEAPLLTFVILLILSTFQCSGTSPNHSIPLSLIGTDLSSPRVTVSLMSDCLRLLYRVAFWVRISIVRSICAVLVSR